ncbi:MAG: hypothetical protein Q8J68_07880 [Methanolobus sp.]|uniref:hypothetical protein n=1 Tax=Methanolobus sp. TaxID=1874737 RepID=UPI0027311DD4|nr:hypothetical protein [Methanolobus sp.]MDP2217187.1 hypothetical protein [Methanolobus sp.]
MVEKGIFGALIPDVEERVNKRMNELSDKLTKATGEMSKEIKDAIAPLIKALDTNTMRVELYTEESKKLRESIDKLTEVIRSTKKKGQ